jgi:hypothetical protein
MMIRPQEVVDVPIDLEAVMTFFANAIGIEPEAVAAAMAAANSGQPQKIPVQCFAPLPVLSQGINSQRSCRLSRRRQMPSQNHPNWLASWTMATAVLA